MAHPPRSSPFPPTTAPDARQLLLAAAGGSAYGLGLARYLFEYQPQRFSFFGAWPGVLLLAVCGAAAVMLVFGALPVLHARPPSAFAALALLLPLVSALAPDVNLLRAQTLLGGGLGLFILLLFFTAENAQRADNLGEDSRPSSFTLGPSSFTPGPSSFTPGPSSFTLGPSSFTLPPPSVLLPCLLFLLLFSLYLRTLGPTVGEADPFEFQVSAYRLGIAHGNGYPLLMLLGKLFSLLPVGGTLAFRVNLTSAFFAALAAVGVERLARRLGAGPLAALLAGFAFGVSPTLWARATEIEAYTLNAAFLAAILYLCVELIDSPHASRLIAKHPSGTPPAPLGPWSLTLLFFLFGLGLTNHLTTLLAAPACALAALASYRSTLHASRLPPPAPLAPWPLALLSFLLGLSVYLYLPLRWPAANNGQMLSLDQFVALVRGGQSTGEFNPALPFNDAVRYASLFRKVVEMYTPFGIALAVIGLIALAAQRPASGRGLRSAPGWQAALLLALTYAANVFFIMAYATRDPDWSDFFIPLHLIAAALMGVGLQAILTTLTTQYATHPSPLLAHVVLSIGYCVFFLLPLHSLWQTLPQVDRSRNWANYRLGQYTLAYPLARDAAILVDPARMAPLYYQQVVEGVRPDLDVILMPDEAGYLAALNERLAAGQTVYVARYLPNLGSAYSLRSVGPLAEVSPAPFTAPVEIAHPLTATLAPNIRLLGFNADSLRAAAPNPLRLTLFWRADAPADGHYLVNLRLLDSEGKAWWRGPGSVPVSGLYPTNAWRPGEIISDFYSIPISAGLPPGDYALQAALFPPFQTSETGWTTLAPITILPPSALPDPPRPLRAHSGPHWLMGYAAPETAAPGSRVTVTLYWLRGESDRPVTAFGETRSLAAWPVGSLIPVEYGLTAPASGERFDLTVVSGERAVCGWLASITRGCALPPIRLAGEAVAEGAVNFANLLVLRRAVIEMPEAARGGQVNVTLEWQGLQTIAEDYTVFVQLVGPDGALHGQVDFWPVKGTLATSRWTPGQVIRDPYTIPLAADAPPGDYTVHAGMYLLATLERLPVLNADGAPIDDKVVLTGLRVK